MYLDVHVSHGIDGGAPHRGQPSHSLVPSTSPLAGLSPKNQRRLSSALIGVYAVLVSEMQLFGTAHWEASGPAYYADHELFGDLYEASQQELDGTIERITAYVGPGFVMGQEAGRLVPQWFERWRLAGSGSWIRAALVAEQDLRREIGKAVTALRAAGPSAGGMESWLQGLLENHDLVLFHLQQRSAPA